MPLHAANWFEIPAADFERARAFYSRIFDCDLPRQEMGGDLMGFLPFEMGKGLGGAVILSGAMRPSRDGPRIYLNGGRRGLLLEIEPSVLRDTLELHEVSVAR